MTDEYHCEKRTCDRKHMPPCIDCVKDIRADERGKCAKCDMHDEPFLYCIDCLAESLKTERKYAVIGWLESEDAARMLNEVSHSETTTLNRLKLDYVLKTEGREKARLEAARQINRTIAIKLREG